MITADYGAFQMITRNLIHNAFKYSYKEGMVFIKSYSHGDNMSIVIEDEGLGMNASQISNIKEGKLMSTMGPYAEKGTGLGLSLSKFFAEKMGGQLLFIPKANGGTKVQLTLAANSPVCTPAVQA